MPSANASRRWANAPGGRSTNMITASANASRESSNTPSTSSVNDEHVDIPPRVGRADRRAHEQHRMYVLACGGPGVQAVDHADAPV